MSKRDAWCSTYIMMKRLNLTSRHSSASADRFESSTKVNRCVHYRQCVKSKSKPRYMVKDAGKTHTGTFGDERIKINVAPLKTIS